jgi:propionyl-CoA carboxylase alpha chain
MNTVLVANRGEIARRIIRTARQQGYRTAVVTTAADADMPYVREADVAVTIGDGPVDTSFIDADKVLEAATRVGADAIHPGYGLLAENAGFARAVVAAGLTWIGPPADAIDAMGDKVAARRLAIEAGVPVVAGYDGDDLAAAADTLGFPVLVKAVAGGGGRGMRRVDSAAELAEAISSAQREAASAFGNGTVFLERFVERARHIEIQVLCDAHGNAVHLFERECSIQRRHQKIIEEAPSPAVDATLREAMGSAAVRLARAVDYEGVGTVEFLVEDGAFTFLEMNTRLQVEHPVTELVTGVDLVALQLSVAEGEPLPFTQADLRITGHAIEARVCAEDPMRDYLPSTGPVWRLDVPDGVRVDSGLEGGNVISPHYDSMVAKIIAFGPTRAVATRRLHRALVGTWMPGPASNLPLLREILAHQAWASGDLHTRFLDAHGLPTAPPLNLERGAVAATALRWLTARGGPWSAEIGLGWRIEGPAAHTVAWGSFGERIEASWRDRGDHAEVALGDGEPMTVGLAALGGDDYALTVDGMRSTVRLLAQGEVVYVHLGDAEAMLTSEPRYPLPAGMEDEPGTCTSPTPGTVVKVHIEVGDPVTAGQALVALEAMKMEHTVTAPTDGIVSAVLVEAGEAVDQGAVLVRIAQADA